MGLFGSIFKGVKKAAGFVAKTALSKATGGVSDQVLKKLKGLGQVKAVLAKKGHQPTQQDQALVNKIMPDAFSPTVKRTEQVLDVVGYKAGIPGYTKPKKAGKGGRTGKPKPKYDASGARKLSTKQDYLDDVEAGFQGSYETWREGLGLTDTYLRLKAKKAKAPKKAKGKRTTSQGQKMAALAAQWRSLGGQAGTGQTFFEWKAGR